MACHFAPAYLLPSDRHCWATASAASPALAGGLPESSLGRLAGWETTGCLLEGKVAAWLLVDGRNRPVETVTRGPSLAFNGNGLTFGKFMCNMELLAGKNGCILSV